jgi:phosphoglucomutase
MEKLRNNPPAEVLGHKLACVNDYLKSESRTADGCVSPITLPKSNVLKFIFEDGLGIIARPSGTEPKLKIYYTVKADSMQAAYEILGKLAGKEGVFAAEVLG